MVTVKNKIIIAENKEAVLCLNAIYLGKHIFIENKQHGLPDALSEEFSLKCLSVMIYKQLNVSIAESIMLLWQPILLYNFHNTRVT